MTALGVFRDDFYNAISVLPQAQYSASTQGTGTVISATLLGGAGDTYAAFSGQTVAQALTTDTAVNIISQLQNAVAAAYKANIAASAANVSPPPGVPNLFNMVYTLTIINNNTSSGAITLTGGTGVTINGTNTIAIATNREFLVTVTSPTTVTLQNLISGTN